MSLGSNYSYDLALALYKDIPVLNAQNSHLVVKVFTANCFLPMVAIKYCSFI